MRALVGLLLGAAFFAALVYTTIRQSGVSCEVCMAFRGDQICESTAGPDRRQAQMLATNSACSRLTAGVTDGIRCNNTAPISVICSE